MRWAEPGVISWNEALIVHRYAEVARFIVSDHLSRIARHAQILPNEFILSDLIRPRNFDHAIHRLSEGYLCYRGSHIIRSHWLHKDR